MASYDQGWCDEIAGAVGEGGNAKWGPLRLAYVVTDTEDGKVAFVMSLDAGSLVSVTAGKLPRGEKADVMVTAKEDVMVKIWAGDRSRDAAFMRGDLKVEGAYERWLDELVPLFEAQPWRSAWAQAGS